MESLVFPAFPFYQRMPVNTVTIGFSKNNYLVEQILYKSILNKIICLLNMYRGGKSAASGLYFNNRIFLPAP